VTPDPFRRFLDRQGFAVLDGGLASALEADGHRLDTSLWSGRVVLDDPDAVRAVHRAYLEAGADCITTAGYQLTLDGIEAAGIGRVGAEAAIRAAVSLAVESRDAFWAEGASREGRLEPIVAASAGPYGAYLADGSEYDGRYGVRADVLERFHRDRLGFLADTAADVLAFETIPSLAEAEVLAALLGERPEMPAWVSFSCRDGRHLWDGSAIEDAVGACTGVEAIVAVGVNCTHPAHIRSLVERMRRVTRTTLLVYPNSGETYDAGSGAWTGTATSWVDEARGWLDAGADVVGGCCRVGPNEIGALRKALERGRGP